ncbi:MAG TPA: DNA gyrase inhibitor YacG [Porticoccaceae bacterium]|nr:DNA gyrase inhibitor YacG [Porticoccaceae bacterium]
MNDDTCADDTRALTVRCPSCQKPVVWNTESAHRPFCCQRCQQLDWGEWATETYSIPVTANEDLDAN